MATIKIIYCGHNSKCFIMKKNKLEVEKVPLSMQNFICVLCSTDSKLQDKISQFFEFSQFSSQFHWIPHGMKLNKKLGFTFQAKYVASFRIRNFIPIRWKLAVKTGMSQSQHEVSACVPMIPMQWSKTLLLWTYTSTFTWRLEELAFQFDRLECTYGFVSPYRLIIHVMYFALKSKRSNQEISRNQV